MKLTADYWIKYINTHTSANKAAERRMERYIAVHGTEDMDKLADYAYALVSKYGEAASALSCEMYDQMARAQNANVPEALPAETASYGEVSKAVRGAGKTSPALISDAVGRLVKQAGADTTLQNAARDGAYFAWVAHGDTCPYCMALAAIGWQKAGKMTLKGGHAEHIHANCDCEYAIDHTGDLEIDGYNPYEINQQLLDMTDGEFDAEDLLRMSGHNGKGHDHSALNIIRRKHYAANRDYINAQKRAAYARRNGIVRYEGIPKDWALITEDIGDEFLTGTNPNYRSSIPNYLVGTRDDYTNNCTNCVVAYDARRKKYYVTACSVGENHRLQTKLFTAWVGREPTETKGSGLEDILAFMKDKKDGTRLAISVQFHKNPYIPSADGHAFIAERIDGKTVFLDPQKGKKIGTDIFNRAKKNDTLYMQIDDLDLSDRGISACKRIEKK